MSTIETREQETTLLMDAIELCHIDDGSDVRALCGFVDGWAPPCPEYDGEAICPRCGRPTCPRCAQRAALAEQLIRVGFGLDLRAF